jgi:hypothetical protein
MSTYIQGADAEEIPEKIKQEMQFLVGDWEFAADENGSKHPGRYSAQWMNNRTVLLMTFRSDKHNATGISSWDPTTNEIVENWFGTATGRLELRYRIKSADEWEGTAKLSAFDGTTAKGTNRVQKTGPDSFIYTEKIGERTMVIENRRIRQATEDSVSDFSGFVGTWEAKLKDGGTRRWSFAWSPERNFLNNQLTAFDVDGETQWSMNGTLGQNKSRSALSNWCVSYTGAEMTFYWEKAEGPTWNLSNNRNDRKWTFTLGKDALDSVSEVQTLNFKRVR